MPVVDLRGSYADYRSTAQYGPASPFGVTQRDVVAEFEQRVVMRTLYGGPSTKERTVYLGCSAPALASRVRPKGADCLGDGRKHVVLALEMGGDVAGIADDELDVNACTYRLPDRAAANRHPGRRTHRDGAVINRRS